MYHFDSELEMRRKYSIEVVWSILSQHKNHMEQQQCKRSYSKTATDQKKIIKISRGKHKHTHKKKQVTKLLSRLNMGSEDRKKLDLSAFQLNRTRTDCFSFVKQHNYNKQQQQHVGTNAAGVKSNEMMDKKRHGSSNNTQRFSSFIIESNFTAVNIVGLLT